MQEQEQGIDGTLIKLIIPFILIPILLLCSPWFYILLSNLMND